MIKSARFPKPVNPSTKHVSRNVPDNFKLEMQILNNDCEYHVNHAVHPDIQYGTDLYVEEAYKDYVRCLTEYLS